MVTQLDRPVSVASELTELADRLGSSGLHARLALPIGRPPTLHVVDPHSPELEELVTVDEGEYRWSWQEPIAPVAATDQAVDCILRMVCAGHL